MEDLFDEKTKSYLVDGKTFSLDKNSDPAKHYGKVVLAHKIIAPLAGSIDFSGFQPILESIRAVVLHQKAL